MITGIAVDQDAHRAYVSTGNGMVNGYGPCRSWKVLQTITVEQSVGAVALDSKTKKVFVTNGDDNTVSVIDEATGVVTEDDSFWR